MLNRLATGDYKLLEPHLQRVPLTFGETIYKSKAAIDYVYFPESGVLSIVGLTGNDKPIEVGLVGTEGFAGLPLFLGVARSSNDVIVQGEGWAQRIDAKAAFVQFRRGAGFHDAVLLFAHELFLQVSRVTSCNRHHDVNQRLSRWLLMMHDRVKDDRLPLTQEFLSWMLGVRNQAVSRAATLLQRASAIKYSRGVVTIVDRDKLEHRACACYGAMSLNGHRASSAMIAPPTMTSYSRFRTDSETAGSYGD